MNLSRKTLLEIGVSGLLAAGLLSVAALQGDTEISTVMLALALAILVFLALHGRATARAQERELRTLARRLDERSAERSAMKQVRDVEIRLLSASERTQASVGRVADELAAMGARLGCLRQDIDDISQAVSSARHSASVDLERSLRYTYQQIEADRQLRDVLRPTLTVPPSRGWAASPDLLLTLVEYIRSERPAVIAECGSGLSTLWMALALERFGVPGVIISLEHESDYATKTRRLLADHGVGDFAEVRDAPLVEQRLGSESFMWYDPAAWASLSGVDLLLIDGPPSSTGDLARYPAVPLLIDRLHRTGTILLDDLVRDQEKRTLRRWLDENPTLIATTLPLEKGCAQITRTLHDAADVG